MLWNNILRAWMFWIYFIYCFAWSKNCHCSESAMSPELKLGRWFRASAIVHIEQTTELRIEFSRWRQQVKTYRGLPLARRWHTTWANIHANKTWQIKMFFLVELLICNPAYTVVNMLPVNQNTALSVTRIFKVTPYKMRAITKANNSCTFVLIYRLSTLTPLENNCGFSDLGHTLKLWILIPNP